MDLAAGVMFLALTEVVLLVRGAGRRRLRRAWEAIHAGQLDKGRRLLEGFLQSPYPRRREPARIALLAAARIGGDRQAVIDLLGSIDRAALSVENRRVLAEEEVRALIEIGDTAAALRAAEALVGGGSVPERRRARELHAYALLADGRSAAAYPALLALREEYPATLRVRRAWACYHLGVVCQRERREGEARRFLEEARDLAAGSPLGQRAAEALHAPSAADRF